MLVQGGSAIGTQITVVGLPLVLLALGEESAVLFGVLAACRYVPFLLFGYYAGALADRKPPRAIMLLADVGRCVILAVIPVLWWFDALNVLLLIAVVISASILRVFFDTALMV
ncbi:hypothetical protein GCM10009676_21060 [Prauserella halophila]|uniref:MFS transporter n=2 Tax=Prauserella halophila TaxID=185641 RepID=A0ABN1W5H2_9PSEU